MSSRTQSPTDDGGIGNELSLPVLAHETPEERRSDLLPAADWRADANVSRAAGAHAVFQRRWPEIAYSAHPVFEPRRRH